MLDASLLIYVVGGVISFWTALFLGSRTAYHPSMRWLRWAFLFTGIYFLLTALESSLIFPAQSVLLSLCLACVLVAVALWHGWVIGVRGITRRERAARIIHLISAAGSGLLFVLADPLGDLATDRNALTFDSALLVALVGVYMAGTLMHIWLTTWRGCRRVATLPVYVAWRILLTATTSVCAGVAAVTVSSLLKPLRPNVANPVELAGHGALCCGVALMGYGALAQIHHRQGLNSKRDYLVSGFAGLGIVAVYEGVLIAFREITNGVLAKDEMLALGVLFIPMIIATYFGFDQLRTLLDGLRFGHSARLVRNTLRVVTSQIGTEKSRDQVLHEVLQRLADILHVSRVALFWFRQDGAHLIAAYGQTSLSIVPTNELRSRGLVPVDRFPGYTYLLPFYVGRRQRGALLLGNRIDGLWISHEYVQLIGHLLAAYIDHTCTEPVTIAQYIHRIHQQERDVQALHQTLDEARHSSVYITTLGPFNVKVGEKPASYDGVRVGRHMLNGMLMYLVANADKPVLRDALIEIASDHRRGRRHRNEPPDDAHYISGLRKTLQRWGMADALEIADSTVTLKRHPSWTTDTDQVIKIYHLAEQARSGGEIRYALSLLENALALFNGDYMQDFDSPNYRLDDEARRWERKRVHMEKCFLEWYLETPDRYDDDAERMLRVAHRLLDRYGDDPDVGDPGIIELVKRVALRCKDRALLRRCHVVRDNLE